MEKLDSRSTLHHILEGPKLVRVVPTWRTEVSSWGTAVIRMSLTSYWRSRIECLVLVRPFRFLVRSSTLRQGPSGEIEFRWRVWRSLGHVTSRTYLSRCRCGKFQTTTSSVPEGELRWLHNLRSHFWYVLRAWGLLKRGWWHLLILKKKVCLLLAQFQF